MWFGPTFEFNLDPIHKKMEKNQVKMEQMNSNRQGRYIDNSTWRPQPQLFDVRRGTPEPSSKNCFVAVLLVSQMLK